MRWPWIQPSLQCWSLLGRLTPPDRSRPRLPRKYWRIPRPPSHPPLADRPGREPRPSVEPSRRGKKTLPMMSRPPPRWESVPLGAPSSRRSNQTRRSGVLSPVLDDLRSCTQPPTLCSKSRRRDRQRTALHFAGRGPNCRRYESCCTISRTFGHGLSTPSGAQERGSTGIPGVRKSRIWRGAPDGRVHRRLKP